MATETSRLHGSAAIGYAEAHDLQLCLLSEYAGLPEDERDDLTPDEARAIAQEDGGRIYLDVELAPWLEFAAEQMHIWAQDGATCIGIRRDGSCYPCRDEDIPRGAVDDYFGLGTPDAADALARSFIAGWTY